MEIIAHSINSQSQLQTAHQLSASRIEFDLVEQHGEIYLAHSLEDIKEDALTLHQALPLLKESGKDLMCDLKSYTPSILEKTAASFQDSYWQDKLIFTSHIAQDTRMLARRVPGAKAAWSIPQVDLAGVQVPVPRSHEDLQWWKANITERVMPSLRFHACDILNVQFELAVPELVKAAQHYGVQIYAWTVDNNESMEQLEQAGVDGLVVDSNLCN